MTENAAPGSLRALDSNRRDRAASGAEPEQLSLLPDSPPLAVVSPRFRLGRATCERGLRHVAEIKEELARRRAEREAASVHRLPPRRRPAA